MGPLKVGVFFFGMVEMDDAGAGPPAPTDRRFSNEAMWSATERMVDMGVRADQLGFDSYWLTEHHFQYEGYEVVPNGIMLGAYVAERTERIRIGALVNIVTQWHPLRMAEDFATMHNFSKGRGILGIGRGTVPREIENLNDRQVSIGSFDNPDKVAADTLNREVFEEGIEVIKLALDNETFAFKGKHYEFPVPGIPDRGATVQALTLVPRPRYPYEVWQTVTSPPTLEYAPRAGHGAVFWLKHHAFIAREWDRYAEVYEQAHGVRLGAGDKRMLVLNIRVGDTMEEAVASVRPGHDEFWKFLGPYGWSKGYMGPDGRPAPAGLIPPLEQSLDHKVWLVGSPADVAEGIQHYRDAIGLEHLVVFPQMPGDSYAQADDQMARIAEEVLPLVR